MARSTVSLSNLLGAAAIVIVVALTLGTIVPLLWVAEAPGRIVGADLAVLRFTVTQAALSALLSVLFAVPLARALARRQFMGRQAVLLLLGAPFIVPVIVAILGLLAVWGRSGWVSDGLGAAGFGSLDIYGMTGVLLAHVFFNLPLVTRMVLTGWGAIPAEQFRLAAQLGFTSHDMFRHIERPMLREILPGAGLIVFLICLTSFAVALVLGGGPRATTLELAIYQSLRFDFDLSRAAMLALTQMGVALVAAILLLALGRPAEFTDTLGRVPQRFETGGIWMDRVVIGAALLFLGLPLGAVMAKGLPALFTLSPSIWEAALRSVTIAIAATAICFTLSLAIAWVLSTGRAVLAEGIVLIGLTASSLVIGTGLFILLRAVMDPFAMALPLTALVNAVMGVPFALRILLPAVASVRRGQGRLAGSLGVSRGVWLRYVLLPGIRRPAGFSLGLVAAFSMGDLGIIALFGTSGTATLPLEMAQLMGAYRMEAAAGAGALLLGLSFALFALFDLGGRYDRV